MTIKRGSRFLLLSMGSHRHHTGCQTRQPAANGEWMTTKLATLVTTVAQNTARNDALFDLWRSICCATSAPGHPPTRLRVCSVLSDTRHSPEHARKWPSPRKSAGKRSQRQDPLGRNGSARHCPAEQGHALPTSPPKGEGVYGAGPRVKVPHIPQMGEAGGLRRWT